MMSLNRLRKRLDAIERRRPAKTLPPLPDPEIIFTEGGGQIRRSWWYRDGVKTQLDIVCPGNVDLTRM